MAKLKVKVECLLFKKQDNKYQYLLLKCVAERGGIWQPITGSVETTDKTILAGAYREILEETGISKEVILQTIENVHYFEMNKHHETGELIETLKEYVFAFEVKPEVKIALDKNIKTEHDEFRWVGFDEALGMLKWQDNKDSFKKLNAKLTQE